MRWQSLVLASVAALAPRGAAAQSAQQLFEDGLHLLDAGKPAEACAKLEQAVRLAPDAPGILLNLGLCNAQQKHVATALKWYRRAQTQAAEHGQAETEAAAKQQTAALAAIVPTIKVELEAPPAGAIVTIDGTTVERASLARIEIDAGKHVVELAGPALATDRQTIEVSEDARDQVVTLHARPAPPPRVVVVELDRGAPARHRAYVVVGIGIGLLAVETGVGIAGHEIFDNAHTLAVRQRWKDIVRYGSTAMFGVGCAALATAAVIYLRAPGKERVERTVVAPIAGPDQLGIAIEGTFR